MEDSGQRKRRLEQMRMQAELAKAASDVETSGSGMPPPLSNPLIEASSTGPEQDKSFFSPRFDFYTDPMAAFSSNKKSNANVQVAPAYSTPPKFGSSPMAQFSSPQPPSPLSPESMNPQMTHSFSRVSPAPHRNSIGNGPRGSPRYYFPPPTSSGVSYRSPGFEGRPFSNYGQHLTQQPSHSPNLSPGYRRSPGLGPGRGRGRGSWHNTRSLGSGRGAGRQPSPQGRFSTEDKPCDVDRFYKKSMIEDPWQFLKPVIWKVTYAASNNSYTPESSKSWTSKSSTNRGGPSAATLNPSSQPSLAEYLAAALSDAANYTENV